MMHKINFTVRYGGLESQVELSTVNGGPSGWFVLIDRFYQGTVVKLNNVWIGHMNDNCKLTEDQIQSIGDRIDTYMQNNGLNEN